MVRTHQGSQLIQKLRLSGLSFIFFQRDTHRDKVTLNYVQLRFSVLDLLACVRHAPARLRIDAHYLDLALNAPPNSCRNPFEVQPVTVDAGHILPS